jgi:hypothetical protein
LFVSSYSYVQVYTLTIVQVKCQNQKNKINMKQINKKYKTKAETFRDISGDFESISTLQTGR